MNQEKRKRLEAAGWKVGTAQDLLDLSSEETEYIELRLRLGDAVKQLRKEKALTQQQLAALMGSSQSRVAKAEAADDSVSLDLLIRSLLALGASTRDLARFILGPEQATAIPG
jgi:predicted XRE-type DNA-binding protein